MAKMILLLLGLPLLLLLLERIKRTKLYFMLHKFFSRPVNEWSVGLSSTRRCRRSPSQIPIGANLVTRIPFALPLLLNIITCSG